MEWKIILCTIDGKTYACSGTKGWILPIEVGEYLITNSLIRLCKFKTEDKDWLVKMETINKDKEGIRTVRMTKKSGEESILHDVCPKMYDELGLPETIYIQLKQ